MTNTENKHESDGPVHIGEAINRTIDLLDRAPGGLLGIPSGFSSLDIHTMGWQAGELAIIGARPAVGNTTFALTLARNAAVDYNIPTAYFSLEKSTVEIASQLIASESLLPWNKLRGKTPMDDKDWSAMEKSLRLISKSPLYIDDTPGLTIEEFISRVKELSEKHGVKLVFVDYLHLMMESDTVNPNLSPEDRNDMVVRSLKQAARLTGTAIIALSYVRRPTRKGYVRPTLPDLFLYSPAAAEYADRIILLNRPCFLHLDHEEGRYSLLEVEVAKNYIGDVAHIDLYLDKESLKIVESRDTPQQLDTP